MGISLFLIRLEKEKILSSSAGAVWVSAPGHGGLANGFRMNDE